MSISQRHLRCANLVGGPDVVGPLTLFELEGELVGLAFCEGAGEMREKLERRYGPASAVAACELSAHDALRRYIDGELDALSEVRVAPAGTPFQVRVWKALREIPARRTSSYGELAAAIGRPSAARAVAAANAANPIPIVIPCHRVIAADGSLCGYSSGVARKHWLLQHERILL